MESVDSTFASLFEQFVDEGKKAFPGQADELEAARSRFLGDEETIQKFAQDCTPLMSMVMREDEQLLSEIGSTRLLEGFSVPADAVDENKAAAMQYLVPLITLAFTMATVPGDTMAKLEGVFADQELMTSISDTSGTVGNVGEMLSSPAGLQLVGNVAKAMGIDMDMNDPMVKCALGMLGTMM